ncbi:hypothetical protein GCM10010441_45350 [Kitasatospora paracochleata]|uniref:Uncharacterized protein n=1 Tax=Kitasatospora paracochleata TaxID=58354 RepID=A0ABT1JAM0_9ACTN|nr:hypothetical protein [Kitasatospora paracochleata]MCP2314113.1 hypothetical protein [Kitasatospora paracochleata]
MTRGYTKIPATPLGGTPSDDTQRRRIRALAGAGRSTAQIWARMMDDHDIPLTYSAINAFLRAGRSATHR